MNLLDLRTMQRTITSTIPVVSTNISIRLATTDITARADVLVLELVLELVLVVITVVDLAVFSASEVTESLPARG